MDDILTTWLTYRQLLSGKLQQERGDAQLCVLKHEKIKPTWWDRYYLSLQSDWIVAREIVMTAYSIPCWFARTIIPGDTFLANPCLQELHEKALGAIIFNPDNHITRISLIHYSITPQHIEYHWVKDYHQSESLLWVRFSTFSVGQLLFYLIEILLPELFSNA